MALKIDSNVTGLRYAEEQSLKTLPGTPVWYPLEPNKYSGFGGKLTTIARKPISQSRQQQKGTVTDLEASGGFEQDLTQNNTTRLFQGFLFADAHEKASTSPMNGVGATLTAVTATGYSSNGTGFVVSDIIYAEGFGVASNNGMKVVSAVSGTEISASGCSAEATPPSGARVDSVGHQFAAGDLTLTTVGGLVRLNSTAVDWTTKGLSVGEWVYVGGDTVGTRFDSAHGFARINAIAAGYIQFDKVDWTVSPDTGTGKTVQVFWGTFIKNESQANLIKRRTYQLERTLGQDANGTMSEYLVGACANEFTLNVKTADKVTAELSFVALDNEQRDGTTGTKNGTRPALTTKDAFNTSSDFSRIKLSQVDPINPAPTPLFTYCTDISLKISNNVTAVKAIGVLGGFETVAGNFVVDGKLTAYFTDIAGVQAVRNNADVTLDIAMVKKNAGFIFDIPLLTLGDGQATVEQDKPIELPLDVAAAMHPTMLHTLGIVAFNYLPTLAE